MWNSLLDVHCIQPETGPVLRSSRIDQRAIVEQRRIAHLGVVTRHSFRLASIGSNPPHIQFVWWKAAHKIYVTAIRGPDVMVTMDARLSDEDLFWITTIAVDNKGRISGSEPVINDPLAVRRPRRVHRPFEKWLGRSAYCRHEPDALGFLAERVCAERVYLGNPQPNVRRVGCESADAQIVKRKLGKPPIRQVHKRPTPDLVDPGVEPPAVVGEKHNELPVGGDGRVGFRAWEISHPLDVGIGQRVFPNLVGPLSPPDNDRRCHDNTYSRCCHPTSRQASRTRRFRGCSFAIRCGLESIETESNVSHGLKAVFLVFLQTMSNYAHERRRNFARAF